jgi:hypothetical protein
MHPHAIALCLIRMAMLEAASLAKVSVGQLSFARALTETRLFFRLLVFTTDPDIYPSAWASFARSCAGHRVNSEPGRQFPRDRQEYRRKGRGLKKRRPSHKPKGKEPTPPRPQPETRRNSMGTTFLLS